MGFWKRERRLLCYSNEQGWKPLMLPGQLVPGKPQGGPERKMGFEESAWEEPPIRKVPAEKQNTVDVENGPSRRALTGTMARPNTRNIKGLSSGLKRKITCQRASVG